MAHLHFYNCCRRMFTEECLISVICCVGCWCLSAIHERLWYRAVLRRRVEAFPGIVDFPAGGYMPVQYNIVQVCSWVGVKPCQFNKIQLVRLIVLSNNQIKPGSFLVFILYALNSLVQIGHKNGQKKMAHLEAKGKPPNVKR